MQAQNEINYILPVSFGCRLNSLETEKIKSLLETIFPAAIIVNSCAVTAEAERQSAQTVRKLARENPNCPIFITGCAATRNPDLFSTIPNCFTIPNSEKMNLSTYVNAINSAPCHFENASVITIDKAHPALSKQFIQVQNGCNHKCAYCVTRLLRGPAVSFDYEDILKEAKSAVKNGFYEIVLTGVDIASYAKKTDDSVILISDLCKKLLDDVPQIQRLRLSSMDPASPELLKIIDLMNINNRMLPHLHLSMQSGSDSILRTMHRRHLSETVRKIVEKANGKVSFGWDIICGFPGETERLFEETLGLVKELKPIRIHAFPFSPRPDTEAATLPNQVERNVSKERVRIISDAAKENLKEFMTRQVNSITQVLVEENNIARTPDDITIKILGEKVEQKTICNVKIKEIQGDCFIAELV